MPLTLSILPGYGAQSVVATSTANFVATVTNTGSTSVVLQSLTTNCMTGTAVTVDQPVFQIPNTPVGVGNPILLPGLTYYYSFQATFFSPYFAGPSPQNAPGGAAPSNGAVTPDPFYVLQVQSLSSDSTVASASLLVPVLSTIAPFPLAQGGGLQFSQGTNLVNLLTSFG